MTKLFDDPSTFSEDLLAGFLRSVRRPRAAAYPAGWSGPPRHRPARSPSSSAADQGTTRRSAGWWDRVSPTARWSATSSPRRRPRRRYSVGRAAAGDGRTAVQHRQLRRRRHELHAWPSSGWPTRASTPGSSSSPTTSPAHRWRRSRSDVASPATSWCSRSRERPPKPATTSTAWSGSPDRANDRTRTLGVAFAGCTLPGAETPLFTSPDGQMGVGLGIHGEPGIAEADTAQRRRPGSHPGRRRARRGARRRRPPGRGDPERAGRHQVRGVVRGLADRSPGCCATPATPWSIPRSGSWSPASTWRAAR